MVCQRGKSTPHRGKWYPADTRFTRLDTNLWEAVIVTGVMHQIRAHAAFVGIALLGDRRYGGAPLPAGFAPPGVTFALHHHEMEGLVTPAPRLATPDWWGGLRAAGSLTR
jgi:23S rRNA-/tRNA-specific pseudouridylate synthase